MAKGKKRGSGAPPMAENKQKAGSAAKADDFSLEAQSIPADALKPTPKQADLRLQGFAPRSRGGAKENAPVLSYRHQDKRIDCMVRPVLAVDWNKVDQLTLDPVQTPISAEIAPALNGATEWIYDSLGAHLSPRPLKLDPSATLPTQAAP